MKTAIQGRARELGFDDCRFATAAPPASAPQFKQWLADGQLTSGWTHSKFCLGPKA